jgi:hypothetical protein
MALALGSFPQVVGTAGAIVLDLADGHGVQTTVELAISSPGESVADDVTGGHLDRRGAGVGGKCRRGAKPSDVTDPGQDLRGGQLADAAQSSQGGAGVCHGRADVAGCGGDAPIQVTNLGDQIAGQPQGAGFRKSA